LKNQIIKKTALFLHLAPQPPTVAHLLDPTLPCVCADRAAPPPPARIRCARAGAGRITPRVASPPPLSLLHAAPPSRPPPFFLSHRPPRLRLSPPLFFFFLRFQKPQTTARGAALHHLPSSGVGARRSWGAAAVSHRLELHDALEFFARAEARSASAPLPHPMFGEPPPHHFPFSSPPSAAGERRCATVTAVVAVTALPRTPSVACRMGRYRPWARPPHFGPLSLGACHVP
jgi:hypothetical protein